MHSPWGQLQPVIEKTGWSLHYIMWKVSWMNIQLIMSDAPGVRSKGAKEKTKNKRLTGKQAAAMFN